ncbi:high-potential iron-sulfur protein [Microbulbifer thermotolerans]|nr:high-potential iron-sulfur protein [Microbulbifer thermotolerans]MCX2780881.1 high-potential iron-sulfur protein [Microbulbifer thermotolerans]MCX2784265.1 high-potential iron-sulfur protein [Microbulbifer thermotolerans]MCX2800990.1 high-potential iron-sulfur protein [Microbulbifer thermotolerans]MCX2804846.1 high-potential iron-sulfur protein [Microbulbifer thermotolerans]MCX2831549.1 high-potential iron-sulfur protein [Microbulbifer thermotolerans]
MNNCYQKISRRQFLKLSGCSLALLPAALIATDRAVAQTKAKKEVVQYQDTPKNGQKCVDCILFEAPEACKVVEGKISPDGWCSLFAPKPS